MEPTDLTGDIAQQAVEPVASTADGQSNTGRAVGELIKAQQFLDAKAALANRRRGLTYTRLVTPGALDDCGRAVGGNFDNTFFGGFC